jgi:hypothetical protein
MNSNGSRIIAAVIAVALVVVLFFAFKGGDDNDSTTSETTVADTTTAADTSGEGKPNGKSPSDPSEPTITIKDGQPVGGIADLTFSQGEDVRFVVDSDTADEVHVHGYDIGQDVEAGGTVEFDFPADLEGVFEVELESSATQIAELTVNP